MNLSALNQCRQVLDLWWSSVHLDAGALFFCGQSLIGRMGRSIRGYHLEGVTSVRQKGSVKGVELVGQVVFEQQPAAFSVPAIIDGVDHLIVVVIVYCPAHANGIAITDAGRRGVEMRLLDAAHA